MKHKQQDNEKIEQISKHLSELTNEERFDVFINKAMKQYRENMSLKGT